jgi:hypothetical protein
VKLCPPPDRADGRDRDRCRAAKLVFFFFLGCLFFNPRDFYCYRAAGKVTGSAFDSCDYDAEFDDDADHDYNDANSRCAAGGAYVRGVPFVCSRVRDAARARLNLAQSQRRHSS